MNETMTIRGRTVERDGAPLVIAEIGVNHDGDIAVARRLVEAAKAAGADAVKFQLFEARLLLAREAGLVEYQKSVAETAHGLLEPLQMPAEAMAEAVAYAHGLGLAAVVTPFSLPLVRQALEMGADAIKLASPDVVNLPLIEEALATGLPLILSSGAARLEEIGQAMEWLGAARGRTALLHCVSSYPTPPEKAALTAISVLRETWPGVAIGYSDHTTLAITGALAVASGACVLEKHLTLDRKRPGPDHAASAEPELLAEYVRLARQAFAMRGPFEKRVQAIEEEVRAQTRQSIAAAADLPAGAVLTRENLTVMRPGTGIPAAGWHDVMGRKLARPVAARTLLQMSDLLDPQAES